MTRSQHIEVDMEVLKNFGASTWHHEISTRSWLLFFQIKDRLYCDAEASVSRRSAVTTLWHILNVFRYIGCLMLYKFNSNYLYFLENVHIYRISLAM